MPPTNMLLQRAPINTSNVCTTPDCSATSAFIKQFVNLTVDPCSDFFEYSCGAWLNAPRIKEKNISIDSFSDIYESNIISLVNIMESSYDDFMSKQLKTNADGFNVVEQADTDRSNFQKAKDYYNTCLHPERSIVDLYPEIAYIRNTLFSINSTVDLVPKNLGHTLAYFTRHSVSSFIDAIVTRNDQNHDYNFAFIQNPTIEEETVKGVEYIIGKALGQQNKTQTELNASRSSDIQLWSQSEVKAAVNTYIDVQAQLKNISDHVDNLGQEKATINRNISALLSSSSIIDWTTYISDLVSPEFAANLGNPLASIQEYQQLLEKTLSSLTLKEVQDFFTVRYVVDRYSKVMFTFTTSTAAVNETSTANLFATNITRTQAVCANEVGTKFYNSIGRFFALKTIGGINEKKEVDNLVHELQTSWLNHLPANPWLDAATKARAVEKINALKPRAVINMIDPDWTNPSSIKTYFDNFSVDTTSYYKSASNYYTWKAERQWKSLGNKVANEQWSEDGYVAYVNAFFAPQLNQVEIPEGIIQRIFYDPKFPKYLNYGGLGTAIGHELTHALDDTGRLYNSTGYKENWWTPASTEAFQNRTQCFVDQYSKDSITNKSTGKKIQIDGMNTLGENIADSGGLTIALTAYREYINQVQQQEPLMPEFESLTQEQMFFIGYVIPRCNYFNEELTGYDPEDEHAPWSIRVKNSLINSAEFAKTFNCPAGSPMNPHKNDEDRCVVW